MSKALEGIRVIEEGKEMAQRLVRQADDPHLRERGTIFDLDHPTRGRFAMIGSPVRLSGSPTEAAPAPLFGEHTEDVLTTLAGYTKEDLPRSREQGVLGGAR